MRLAAFTDYGLRVLMCLAGAPHEAVWTRAIAEEFAILSITWPRSCGTSAAAVSSRASAAEMAGWRLPGRRRRSRWEKSYAISSSASCSWNASAQTAAPARCCRSAACDRSWRRRRRPLCANSTGRRWRSPPGPAAHLLDTSVLVLCVRSAAAWERAAAIVPRQRRASALPSALWPGSQ